MQTSVYKAIKGYAQLTSILKEEEPMAAHTTFKIGGNAQLFASVRNEQDILACVELAKELSLPWVFIGCGSNLLVADEGLQALVICPCEGMKEIRVEDDRIHAQAGARLSALAQTALKHSLTGLEFAGGIPGSLGGAAYMNAGAYGEELSGVFESGRVLLPCGEVRTYTASEMAFGYRHSRLMDEGGILLECTLRLEPGNEVEIKDKMDDLAARRREKQPLNYPSAGSFFKRPAGDFAGRLIEAAGMKGAQRGGAQVSPKHAGFIVNVGNATAADVKALMKDVQDKVYADFGVLLESEVRFLG